MKIGICDDEKTTLNYLKNILKEHYGDEHEVVLFQNVEKLLSYKSEFDVLIMDIRLGDKNGIDAAKERIKETPDTKVIFITGFPTEYFEEIFKDIQPFGYIGKPIDEKLLFRHIDRIDELNKKKKTFDFSVRGVSYTIPLKNIMYFESHGRQKFIITKSGKYIVNLSFDEIENSLSDEFVRCHVAYVVNLNFIGEFINNLAVLKNGTKLPISRKYKENVRRMFFIFKEKSNG